MPMAAPSLRSCGCIVRKGERCLHMIERDKVRKAQHDAKRPTASARGYGSKWRAYRAAYLKANPVCVRCPAPATIVDHVTPHKGNMRLFWNPANHQALCEHCHNTWKQSQERRA